MHITKMLALTQNAKWYVLFYKIHIMGIKIEINCHM